MTDPYDDPDWAPWDVESARRWVLPPVPGVPTSANWCSACNRLERRRDPLHNSGTAEPVDPPVTCRTTTVHAVTVIPTEPVLPTTEPAPPVFAGFWCPQCRYLVPSATEPHPDERSRPSRTPGCKQAAIYRADVMDDPMADAPLLAAWSAYRDRVSTPFTIPGHKGRAGKLWPGLGAVLDGDVPLYGGLDTVKQVAGTLADAERRAARLWGADWCRFSVGGSTHANQALALAVGAPGDKVLVTRAAHRSTLLGLVLAGLVPVWLAPEVDAGSGLPLGVAEDTLRSALRAHPDVRAVFLVEPSYLGTVSDLGTLVEVAHAAGLPVLVDQAWAAHFGFHPDLPRHALAAGADALVTSAHKTLPAYSQASLVLARGGRLDRHRLESAFEAGHTTSPAGSVLASIDGARALLAAGGEELLGRTLALVAAARRRLREVPDTLVPGPEDFAPGRFDPAKLVVILPGTGADGIDVERRLIAAGVPVEMADRDTVVPIVTLVDDAESVSRLVDVLAAAIAAGRGPARPVRTAVQWAGRAVAAMAPREAFFARHETVAAAHAVGRVCAEVVAPYPPGVPVLIPGEIVTAELLAALAEARAAGTRIAYAADPDLATLQVVAA